MKLEICRIDSGRNIDDRNLRWLVQSIDSFEKNIDKDYAVRMVGNLSNAFSFYALPSFSNGYDTQFVFSEDALQEDNRNTLQGNRNPAALASYCRKHGVLYDQNGEFKLSAFGRLLLNKKIDNSEFAFLLLSKQWIRLDGICKRPLLSFIYEQLILNDQFLELFNSDSRNRELQLYFFKNIAGREFNADTDSIDFTRFDILRNVLLFSGLFSKKQGEIVVEQRARDILKQFMLHEDTMIRYRQSDGDFYEYMCNPGRGALEIIDASNAAIFSRLYPNILEIGNLCNLPTLENSSPRQIVYFGAPGTSKSTRIKNLVGMMEQHRVTFHPDTDYASFVGCYKPTQEEDGREIAYKFVAQSFIKAYVSAWKKLYDADETQKEVFLVIEEINRGNCAQIFGDLFQLLDRDEKGYSDYTIEPDSDLGRYLKEAFASCAIEHQGIKNGEIMMLPPNLYIWATMNTSDQSLFPIDSAFKRRWDWKYTPIKDAQQGHVIKLKDCQYDWWEFLTAVNARIEKVTESEDKQMGYWFAKPENGVAISADKFVSKVIFYLWNDVFKDYGHDANSPFVIKQEDGKKTELRFKSFFDEDGEVDENVLIQFFEGLKLQPKAAVTTASEADTTIPSEVETAAESNETDSTPSVVEENASGTTETAVHDESTPTYQATESEDVDQEHFSAANSIDDFFSHN